MAGTPNIPDSHKHLGRLEQWVVPLENGLVKAPGACTSVQEQHVRARTGHSPKWVAYSHAYIFSTNVFLLRLEEGLYPKPGVGKPGTGKPGTGWSFTFAF